MKKSILFPGQGSQAIGMGKDLYDNFSSAKEVFEEVNQAVEFDIADMIFNGSIEDLSLTENTQPALMAVSIAFVRVLEKEVGKKISEIFDVAAGHSLGEYSALCATGAISLFDTAKILKKRGQFMQSAVPKGKGGMIAILGLSVEDVKNLITKVEDLGNCSIANDNCDGQIVVSGEIACIDELEKIAKEFGAKRALKLPVSAPFHCSLMLDAEKNMTSVINETTFNTPSIPVISNVYVEEVSEVEKIKDMLIKQICGSVRWRETMDYLVENNYNNAYEFGSGKVISGLTKRVEGLECVSICDMDSLNNFIKEV